MTGETRVELLSPEQLEPNDYNPNRMTEDEFSELVAEVKHLGRLPKPVVVRPGSNEKYLIVDGEHGWKAAQAAGLAEIPCELVEADDFEAMRQTYKRNQHGTHNKLLLGRMFKRMGKERDLSIRKLAKEIEVSEGTIRNAVEYVKAAKVRNSYAKANDRDEESDVKIVGLSVRQVRYFNRLPETVANMWLDSGAGILTLYKAEYDEGHKYKLTWTEDDIKRQAKHDGCDEVEFVVSRYKRLAESGLLQYAPNVYDTESFVTAIKRVKGWLRWEQKYFFRILSEGSVWYTRDEFRKYARYYYEGKWPFTGSSPFWMECALNCLIEVDPNRGSARFRLAPDEFDAVVQEMETHAESQGSLSYEAFGDYLRLAVLRKTGLVVNGYDDVKDELIRARLKDAPDYIRHSKLAFAEYKRILWDVVEEMQEEKPDQKATIEKIARELAAQEWLPSEKGKSHREATLRHVTRILYAEEEDMKRQSASKIELAMQITDFVYDKEKQKERHKAMALKLASLEKPELERVVDKISFCEWARAMHEVLNAIH